MSAGQTSRGNSGSPVSVRRIDFSVSNQRCNYYTSEAPGGMLYTGAPLPLPIHSGVYIALVTFGFRYKNRQDAQLSQRDRAAGCVIVFAKSRTLELRDNILRTL